MANNEDIVDRLQRIETKQDDMQQDMKEMLIVLTRNTADVEYHIKRSDIAEENIELLRTEIQKAQKNDERISWTIGLIVALAAIVTFLRQMGII